MDFNNGENKYEPFKIVIMKKDRKLVKIAKTNA